MIRLYGRGQGYASQARVTSGFKGAFERAGILSGFFDLDQTGSLGPGDTEAAGATAPIAVFTGPLSHLWRMEFNAKHTERWALVAPNSDEIGARLRASIENHATHLIAPSSWASNVLQKHFPELPVMIARHGVEAEFSQQPCSSEYERRKMLEWQSGQWRVLHLASTGRQRKGTTELIEAWKLARKQEYIPKKAQLFLILERETLDLLVMRDPNLQDEGIIVNDRMGRLGEGLSPQTMAMVYRSVHLVIQPSRGEAFGMVPLEARAAGTPVAATACTGHSEHVAGPGVVVIPHSDPEPIDDLPGAMAPSVTVEAIQGALAIAHCGWPELHEGALWNATNVQNHWSWDNQLTWLINHYKGKIYGKQ